MLYMLFRSSSSHTWDAFQLAHSSFRLYCVRNNRVLPNNSENDHNTLGPSLLGDPPKINVPLPEAEGEVDEEKNPEGIPAIKIHDDDVNVRFLVCGSTSTLVSKDSCLFLNNNLGSLGIGIAYVRSLFAYFVL